MRRICSGGRQSTAPGRRGRRSACLGQGRHRSQTTGLGEVLMDLEGQAGTRLAQYCPVPPAPHPGPLPPLPPSPPHLCSSAECWPHRPSGARRQKKKQPAFKHLVVLFVVWSKTRHTSSTKWSNLMEISVPSSSILSSPFPKCHCPSLHPHPQPSPMALPLVKYTQKPTGSS